MQEQMKEELSNVRVLKPMILLGKRRKFDDYLTVEELKNFRAKNAPAYMALINQGAIEVVEKSSKGHVIDAGSLGILKLSIEALEAKVARLEARLDATEKDVPVIHTSDELALSNFKKGDSFKFKGATESEVLSGVATKVSHKNKTVDTEVDGVEWSVPFEDILEV